MTAGDAMTGPASMNAEPEFKDSGNGWAALAFAVCLVLGVLFIAINPLRIHGWLLVIAGSFGGWHFMPRSAETNRKNAEQAANRRAEQMEAAATQRESTTPFTDRVTWWQPLTKFSPLIRRNRSRGRLQKDGLGAPFERIAGDPREIDALRYWILLPSRVQVRFDVDPDKARLGPASLKRRSQNDVVHVGLDSTANGAVPVVHVATAMMGAIGRFPDEWAIRVAPFFEAGGTVRARFIDAGIVNAGGGYSIWAVVEVSPVAAG
jgi:hypothetical protein